MLSAKMNPPKPAETLLSKCEIPIIDLAHIGTETCPMKSVVKRVGAQLYKALSEKGLALLVNHGISDDKLKAAYHCLDDFCALPEDTQSRFLRTPSTNHGYVKPGMERFDGKTMELRHSFNITTLNENELPEVEIIPEFGQNVKTLVGDFTNLSSLLLKALAVALELSPTYFIERHQSMMNGRNENQTTLRLLYYPPIPPSDERKAPNGKLNGFLYPPESCHGDYIRCGAHCDYGTFTLLAQDCEGGLEVKLNGSVNWQRVGHLPGALLVNTGELLAAWTQDRLPALLHRVVVPEQSYARARGRHSIAFFCHPDDSVAMEPLPAPVPPLLPPTCEMAGRKGLQNRVVNAYHHIQKRFRETYA